MSSRLNNPGTRHFNASGEPLTGGKLFFYEPGTTTPKTTYSDATLNTANANPVILLTGGLEPNIFLDGSYRVILQNADGVQQWDRDNVNIGSGEALANWSASVTYDQDDVVYASDFNYYISLTSSNLGNDPTSSPAEWAQIEFLQVDEDQADLLEAIAALTPSDSNFIVGDGSTWVAESGSTVRDSLGLGTGNDVEFNALDNTVIGGNTPAAATVTDLTATGTVDFSGATVSDLGTVTTADINGGTIDGTVIGGNSAAAITGTTGSFSSTMEIGGNTIIGSTSVTPDGTLHVYSGSAGAFSPSANGGDFIVESGASVSGMTLAAPDAGRSYLAFGSPSNNLYANVTAAYNSNFVVATRRSGLDLILAADNNVTNLTLSGGSGSELAEFAGDVEIADVLQVNPSGFGPNWDDTLHYARGSFLAVGRSAPSNTEPVAIFNRANIDGEIIVFSHEGAEEGNISISGTTVSYNGAHLARWSQLPGHKEREYILRGTVLSNVDEMCEWGDEDNEQLNRMKVSDKETDPAVSGVFQVWDDDEIYPNDFYCAMTGDFIIRIGKDTTVKKDDLVESNGDGTARPQEDDLVRASTVAKITSTHVACTYDDGSYCVPCVLMAC